MAVKADIDSQNVSYESKVSGAEKARNARKNISDIRADQSCSILISEPIRADQSCSVLIEERGKEKKENEEERTKEEEKEIKEKEKEVINAPARKKQVFVPPTLEEVTAYCKSRSSSVSPKYFFDYFEAGEWKDGNGKQVINWKQKLITWERMGNGQTSSLPSIPKAAQLGRGRAEDDPEMVKSRINALDGLFA